MGADARREAARPAGQSGKPSRPARRAARSNFKRIRLRTLTVLAAGVVFTAVMGLIGWTLWGASRAVGTLESAQYVRLSGEIRARLDRLESRDHTRLMDAAFSDALYAMVSRGPVAPDSMIRPSFAESFPSEYGDKLVVVYGSDGRRLYGWADSSLRSLEPGIVTNPLLRMLDNREPATGLLRVASQLLLVAGAPVLPSNYADTAQPIRGYVVVAQPFVASTIGAGIGDRGGRLVLEPLVPSKTLFAADARTVAGNDSVAIRFALPDIFAQQTTLATLTTSRGDFRGVENQLRRVLLVAALGALLTALAVWYAAQRVLVKPLSRLGHALSAVSPGAIPGALPPVGRALEWRTLTGLMNRLLTVSRGGNDRLERATAAVRDGVWEHDFETGETWYSAAFRAQLGAGGAELPNSLAALEGAIHPEDRPELQRALATSRERGQPLDLTTRMRRASGGYFTARLTGDLGNAPAGGAPRLVGTLIDLTPEHLREEAVQAARADVARADARARETIAGLTRRMAQLESPTEVTDFLKRLELLVATEAGSLAPHSSSFDLHDVLERASTRVGGPVTLSVVPGLPIRFTGDADQLSQAVTELLRNARAATTGPITLAAERASLSTDETRVRVIVSHPASDADRTGITDRLAALSRGDFPTDGRIGLALAQRLARNLGGDLEVVAGGDLRVALVVPLPAAPNTYAEPVASDFGDELPTRMWQETPRRDSGSLTFDAPSNEPPVELMADETVELRLDDGNGSKPVETPAVDPATLAELAQARRSGGGLGAQMASIFLHDVPLRLTELKGAVLAAEPGTVHGIAQNLRGMAQIIGAKPLASLCKELEESTEGEAFTLAGDIVRRLEHEFERVRQALAGSETAAEAPAARPAIDPATLEQLRQTQSGSGSSLASQLVTMFLANAPLRLEGIEEALQRHDGAGVRSQASDLKGMCRLVGAVPMAELCETLSRLVHLADGTALLRQLQQEYGRVTAVLDETIGAAR